MELALNLGWALLAALMVGLWMRHGPRQCADRRTQLVALALLLVVLFPVISVSDDLQSLNNPAEIDSAVRRTHAVASPHTILPAISALIEPLLSGLSLGAPRFAAPAHLPLLAEDHPCLVAIDNRPPPAWI